MLGTDSKTTCCRLNKMSVNLFLLLLGAILVLQPINAAPHKSINGSARAVAERIILTNLAASELTEIIILQFRNGKDVMEKVLTDPKVLEYQSDLMNSNLNEMRAFIAKLEKFEEDLKRNKAKRNEVLDNYDRIVSKYDARTSLKTPEDKAIQNSFKENGFMHFADNIQERVKIYTDKIYAEVEKYLGSLSEAERNEEIELMIFVQKFKAESNVRKRGDLIMELISGFQIEKLLQ